LSSRELFKNAVPGHELHCQYYQNITLTVNNPDIIAIAALYQALAKICRKTLYLPQAASTTLGISIKKKSLNYKFYGALQKIG